MYLKKLGITYRPHTLPTLGLGLGSGLGLVLGCEVYSKVTPKVANLTASDLSVSLLGLKKKDVCLPFSDRPKISENRGQLFFF